MNTRNPCVFALALLAAACGSIEGTVRDGSTGTPIAGATVTLTYNKDPSGFFGAPQTAQAESDDNGHFVIAEAGGYRLGASTRDGRSIDTSPCPQSPVTIYVGGPNPGLRLNRILEISSSGEPQPGELSEGERTPASTLGLSFRELSGENGDRLVVEADGGVAYVAGTGAIPAAPTLPYDKTLTLDFRKDCGWIFVEKDGEVAAVISARSPGKLVTPGGFEQSSLMFAKLP